VCLNCLIAKASTEDLDRFTEKLNVTVEGETKNKFNYFQNFARHLYNEFHAKSELKDEFLDPLNYIGTTITESEEFKKYNTEFDFIAKKEMINKFADFCADLGISVYGTSEIPDYSLDLYLIRRTPLLRTEAAFVRTGDDLSEDNYEKLLGLIVRASRIATWTVFVTSSFGALKIGLNRLIRDMEKLNVWFYVVDPSRKKIFGLTKGKKSKDLDTTLRDQYIQKLTHDPIRAPSKVVKVSKYYFKEGESYKSKEFSTFEILSNEDYERMISSSSVGPKYQKIFKNMLIIDNVSGISIFSYQIDKEDTDDQLISGFLSAMENFVSELGGPTSLKEINYKDFFVLGENGEMVKMALFLAEPADQILKERFAYFVKHFERRFKEQVQEFRASSNIKYFENNKEIISMIKETLEV
jgi:hypothetical protein